jgi:hypothetical protein
MYKTIKIRRIDSRTIKTRRREAQLTDSFGEALYLGLAPRPGREQQKTVLRQSLYWLDRKITAIQRPKQSVCSWLPIGRVMKESFMARALNKNKKPETKNKNRACNYFLGSFGSPCGFRDSENPCGSEPAREKPIGAAGHLIPALSLTTIASVLAPTRSICAVLHHPPTKC